jgi:enoyl-CoA hydratase/carnithine racemase
VDFVRVEREEGGIAVLIVDRQEKLNALDSTVVEEMTGRLSRGRTSPR